MPNPSMTFSNALPPFVMEQEGYRSEAYPDHRGLSIGFGTNGPWVKPGMICTREQATHWMLTKLAEIARDLNSQVTVSLAQCQFDALCDFCYNLGDESFEGSTLHRLLNEGNFEASSDEFPKWDKYHDEEGNLQTSQDLLERRLLEQSIFNGKGAPSYAYPAAPGLANGSIRA